MCCAPMSSRLDRANMSNRPSEFELIAQLFAPLAAGQPGAFGLTDDCAVIAPTTGAHHVVTTDTLVAGVHFLIDDPPDLIARKLLRVNLSDLASMGAWPTVYLLAISLPQSIDLAWLERFVSGLATDQKQFGVGLVGGDTTSTPGPLTLTVTAIGEVRDGWEIRRSGAHAGDLVVVSGTIGDAALGLQAGRGGLASLAPSARETLIARYRLPTPRLALGQALVGYARSAIDVSDGLVADLGHVAQSSRVAIEIEAAKVPLTDAARAAVAAEPALLETAFTGGDDYELAFTVPAGTEAALPAMAERGGVPITIIGRTRKGTGIRVLDASGRAMRIAKSGWRHF